MWWNTELCVCVCMCVFVFPAIVRRRLIPPLFTDRWLSKLPELIIKSNNSNLHTLSACLPAHYSVCLSALYCISACLLVCLWTVNLYTIKNLVLYIHAEHKSHTILTYFSLFCHINFISGGGNTNLKYKVNTEQNAESVQLFLDLFSYSYNKRWRVDRTERREGD